MRRPINDRANTLAIDQAVLDALSARIEQPQGNAAAAARSSVRIPYRRISVRMSILHADGTAASILVACRNLSSGGIGLFHSSYMHVGTPCAIALPRQGKPEAVVRGTIVRCRHVGGRVHELGVRFFQPIEPRDFIETTPQDVRAVLAAIRPAEFTAALAMVVVNDSARRELERALAETRAKVHLLKPDATANGTPCQCLIAELADLRPTPNALLRLAELSGGAPVVLVAADNSRETEQRLQEFPCSGILTPPFTASNVARTLTAAITLSVR
jgi:AmiR/NasT family two-component response regulator